MVIRQGWQVKLEIALSHPGLQQACTLRLDEAGLQHVKSVVHELITSGASSR